MPKKGIALLLGPHEDEEEPEDEGEDMSVEDIRKHQEECAHDLFDAIEAKDAKKFVECYSTIHKLDHQAMDAGDEDDEEP